MTEQFHRPVRRPTHTFDKLVGSSDPEQTTRVAHATASALLNRARTDETGEAVERLISYTAEHGIDEMAELWSTSPARTLPGAMWRLYLLQLAIHSDAQTSALLYERGRVELPSSDAVVAGAPVPATPDELVALVNAILRGAFRGDFAVALDRAAAFCRVQASGATHTADDYEATEPQRATELTKRALRLSTYAGDLKAAATLWRSGSLD